MKQGIHPDYEMREIACVCGATYQIHSTRPIRKLEICSSCHPFYTGKQKMMDTAGRVEKFKKRFAKFDKAE